MLADLHKNADDSACFGVATIIAAAFLKIFTKNGLEEYGNHEELMAKNGFYADLYNSQFKK